MSSDVSRPLITCTDSIFPNAFSIHGNSTHRISRHPFVSFFAAKKLW